MLLIIIIVLLMIFSEKENEMILWNCCGLLLVNVGVLYWIISCYVWNLIKLLIDLVYDCIIISMLNMVGVIFLLVYESVNRFSKVFMILLEFNQVLLWIMVWNVLFVN